VILLVLTNSPPLFAAAATEPLASAVIGARFATNHRRSHRAECPRLAARCFALLVATAILAIVVGARIGAFFVDTSASGASASSACGCALSRASSFSHS
jgi:hypothetical protein